MARTSTTRYAIMALLTVQPMSGYDVRRALESIGGFWHESDGQIYPNLKKLVAEGLADKTVERQDGKPDRHVHTLTSAGQDVLNEWLQVTAVPARLRDELLLKLFFGALLSPEDSRQQLEQYQKQTQENLALYTHLQEALLEHLKDSPDLPFRMMTVRYGISNSQAALDWCTECLQMLETL